MKKLEYILNVIHYGFYLFLRKTSIPPGRADHYFTSKGLGLFWGGSIVLNLYSIVIIINKFLNTTNIMPLWVVICIALIIFGIQYYFIDKDKKRLIYVRRFMRENKPWKYILISLLFGIGSMVFFCLSLAIKF